MDFQLSTKHGQTDISVLIYALAFINTTGTKKTKNSRKGAAFLKNAFHGVPETIIYFINIIFYALCVKWYSQNNNLKKLNTYYVV